ncbi:MAG TPA: ABC transporter substrate-binding protein [Mobilitalea sp.]|nr:ABC transporter substrate-binding protein [Mobilitalea sp.]
MKKQGLTLLLIITMIVGILSGCSTNKTDKDKKDNKNTNETSQTQKAGETADLEDTDNATEQKDSESADSDSSQEDAEIVDSEAGDTITIIDHAGNEVEVPRVINRIVNTDVFPFASVLSVFLGSAEKLIGIHPASMSAATSGLLTEIFPEIVNANTTFMEGGNLNIEALLELEPDVVFYNAGSVEQGDMIRNAGLTAVGISATKWDYDILTTYDQWIATLSQMFPDSDISNEISNYSIEIYDNIQKVVSGIEASEKKKILFLFKYDDTQMITSGKNFFGQFWCESVGGINVAEEVKADNSNAVINMEQVYEWNPDIIFITNFTPTQPEDLYNNAIAGDDWSSINAVKNHEVYKLPLGTYRSYTPSTDTPVVLLWMAQKVYPQLFKDIDIIEEVKDYYSGHYGIALTEDQIDRMYNPTRAAAKAID